MDNDVVLPIVMAILGSPVLVALISCSGLRLTFAPRPRRRVRRGAPRPRRPSRGRGP